MRSSDDARRSITGGDPQVARLKKTQAAHWDSLFQGTFDERYVARATAIGRAHHRIGLSPRWYLGSYVFFLEHIFALCQRALPAEALLPAFNSVLRAVMVDIDIALAIELQAMWENALGVKVQPQKQEWKVYLDTQSATNYMVSQIGRAHV